MAERAARASGTDELTVPRRNGWDLVDVRGSHHHPTHSARDKVTVPVHGTIAGFVETPTTLGEPIPHEASGLFVVAVEVRHRWWQRSRRLALSPTATSLFGPGRDGSRPCLAFGT